MHWLSHSNPSNVILLAIATPRNLLHGDVHGDVVDGYGWRSDNGADPVTLVLADCQRG